MMQTRNLAAVLALGALSVLPACSNSGGGSGSQYSAATPPASYNTASTSNSTGTSGTYAPVSPGMIRQVQTSLQQNGDYKGHVDGIWGPMTENGVRTWQQAHNLTTNGEIDTPTLQSMNIPTGNQATAQPATQPTGNPNYSTGANNTAGSSYSSNNGQAPQAPASPAPPTNQGVTGAGGNGGGGNGGAAGGSSGH